jgi:hypothetical protein
MSIDMFWDAIFFEYRPTADPRALKMPGGLTTSEVEERSDFYFVFMVYTPSHPSPGGSSAMERQRSMYFLEQ